MVISALGKTLCRLFPCVGSEVLREWARYLEHAGLAILGRDAERLCYFLYSSIAYSPVVAAMVTFTNAPPG